MIYGRDTCRRTKGKTSASSALDTSKIKIKNRTDKTEQNMRKVAIALESTSNGWDGAGIGPEPKESKHQALARALDLLLRQNDELHLVSVKNRVPCPLPMPSILSPADREVFCPADTRSDESARVDHLLSDAARSTIFNNYHPAVHAVDPEGGVREALVQFCKQHEIELLVLGPVRESKGMYGVLRSLLGFGSVSEYSLHHLDVPIAVFHDHMDGNEEENVPKNKDTLDVLVCVDCMERPESNLPLIKWVVDNVESEKTQIHIVSCALRAPYDIVEEECACAIGEIHREEDERDDEMHAMAEAAVVGTKRLALELGARDVRVDVVQAGGDDAGEVVNALTKYVGQGGFDLVCLGKRENLSAVSRTLNHWLGDGSVSDGLVTNELGGALVVVVPTVVPTDAA